MEPVYFQGLKKRPLFDEIVGYLETQQQMMKYPDRTATRIKDSHYYTNLDGQGGMSLADQVEKVQKERLMQEMRRQNAQEFVIHTPSVSDKSSIKYTPEGRTPLSFMSARDVESVDWDDLDKQDELQAQVEAKRKKLEDTLAESVTTTQARQVFK